MFISRSPSSNMASSPQTDHGPASPPTDHGPPSPHADLGPPSPQTDHGPPSPQMVHGPPSPHADLGPFVERNQNRPDGEGPCSTGNMDESDILYSEQRVQMLQNNGPMVCVELRDHGPLSTHHGDDQVIRNSVDGKQVNNLDSDVNTLNTETQFHSHCDHWPKKQARTNSLTILATPPDSLCHMDLSQQSSGRTDSQGFSESSRIGETTQTSDSEPNFENISNSEESTDPGNASGIDLHKEYSANNCDSTQDGRQHDVATRWPCSAASGGNLQVTNGHVDSDSARKDAADVQPVIQVVVGFSRYHCRSPGDKSLQRFSFLVILCYLP